MKRSRMRYNAKGGVRLEQAEKSRSDMSEYYSQMDISMKEKVDSVAHFIDTNTTDELVIYDIGTGTGMLVVSLYIILKSRNPELNLIIVGVDLMACSIETAIENAQKNDVTRHAMDSGHIRFHLSNASAINDRSLPKANYVIYSSILHEVYSYTEQLDESHACSEIKRIKSVENAFDAAYGLLKPNGKVIIRDFIRPEMSDEIVEVAFQKSKYLDICERFSSFVNDHRKDSRHYFLFTLVYPSCKTLHCFDGEYLVYETNLQTLYEFLYRKDYVKNWDVELNERYGFWTETGVSTLLSTCGFRLESLRKYHNPWIMKNRMKNIYVYDKSGYVGIPYYQAVVLATKM